MSFTKMTDEAKLVTEALSKRMDDMEKNTGEELKEFRNELNSKVNFSTFSWVMGILFMIVLAAIGYMVKSQEAVSKRLDAIYEKQVGTQNEVSKIWGKLEPFDVIFKP